MRLKSEDTMSSTAEAPALGIKIDEIAIMSLDGQKHATDGIRRWDLTQKFGQWFS